MSKNIQKNIDVGYQCLRNEEKRVRGWAKIMLYFCKEVYANIDPDTTDKTEEILRTEFPQIHILFQDRTLGDSDYDHKGPTEALRMHVNNTHFMNLRVQTGQWVFFFAADERFHPDDLEDINKLIYESITEGHDGIVFTEMYEFVNKEQYANFSLINQISQEKFFKKPDEWIQYPKPHANRNWHPQMPIRVNIPLYHYPNPSKVTNSWVYKEEYENGYSKLRKAYGFVPLVTCKKLIKFWEVYPALDKNGNLIKKETE